MEKIRNIRNLFIKSVMMIGGLVIMGSQVYPFILRGFLLTDKIEVWDGTEWILFSVGFFLAVGAAQYNTMIDIIVSKFNQGKKP